MKLMDSCVLIMLLFVYFRNPWLKSRFFLNLCQLKCLIFILLYKITAKLSKNQFHEILGLNLWDIRNHDPPEIEPVYIPELTYVEDSDYDNSGSQIPVFDEWY